MQNICSKSCHHNVEINKVSVLSERELYNSLFLMSIKYNQGSHRVVVCRRERRVGGSLLSP